MVHYIYTCMYSDAKGDTNYSIVWGEEVDSRFSKRRIGEVVLEHVEGIFRLILWHLQGSVSGQEEEERGRYVMLAQNLQELHLVGVPSSSHPLIFSLLPQSPAVFSN